MFQTIGGIPVFVVDLTTLPELPITDGGIKALAPYAEALDNALRDGTIKEPGKYGIFLDYRQHNYVIYAINE